MRTRSRTALGATLAAAMLVMTVGACNTVAPTGPSSGKTPIVLVHGYIEGNIIWGSMQTQLKGAGGYTAGDITNFGYDTTGAGQASAAATAAGRLATAVNSAISYARANGNPNASKVDIISHSYGSLVTRYCMALGQCQGKVNHWVSLAGADGGTQIAAIPQLLGQGSGTAMAPNGATVASLKTPQAIQTIRSQGVKIRVFWSQVDGIISPARNSQWPTPTNPEPGVNVMNNAVTHLTIFNNPQIMQQTIAFLRT
jgi:triacylglycerol lipase